MRVTSMSLSESKIVSIRNTSIYQDFRFSHLSAVGGQNPNPTEEMDLWMEDHAVANLFHKEPPLLAPPTIEEEAYESAGSTHRVTPVPV